MTDWRDSVTKRSRLKFRLRLLGRHTSDTELSLFPTPSVSAARQGQNDPDGKRGQTLVGAARGQLWPTPNVCGGGNPPTILIEHKGHYVRPSGKKAHLGLDQAVKLFPTPTGDDANNVTRKSGAFQSLTRAVMLGTPTSHPRTHDPRQVDHGKQLANQVGGSLNPEFVEWLMGFPVGWTDLRRSVMPLFPKSSNGSVGE